MNEQLTDWYERGVKPAKNGVYETSPFRDDTLPKLFQSWNGKYWGTIHYSPKDAEQESRTKSDYQNMYWRGLAQDPNA